MLDHLTGVEIGNEPAVRFCGWLFAMNNAKVTRFESSDLANTFSDIWSDTYLNAQKHLVHLESLPQNEFQQVVKDADVVIGDPDIDWNLFVEAYAITGTVDPFAINGPYAHWQGSELIYASLGGATGYTFARNEEPVYGYGDRFQYLAGTYLYQAICSCLIQRDISGQTPETTTTPRVRVSNFESVVSLSPYLTTQYEYNGSESTREQSGPRFINRCRDGFVVVYAGFAWEPIAKAIERTDLLDDVRFVGNADRFKNLNALEETLDTWAATRSVEEAIAAGERHNVAITAIRSPEASLADESLNRRGVWVNVNVNGESGRIPGTPYTVNERRPHNAEGYAFYEYST